MSGFWDGQTRFPFHYFVLGCWFSLQVTLYYLPGHLRLPHVTWQCLKKSFVKPVLSQLLAHEPNQPARCVTDLFPLSAFTLRMLLQAWCPLKQLLWKCPARLNVPYGSVSCCCGIFVIELVILYFHYLNICNFQIYCSEVTHLTIHVVRWKLSGFFWFPVCLGEVPEFSDRCHGCGREDKIYPFCIPWLIHTWIPLSKRRAILLLAFVFRFQLSLELGCYHQIDL